MMIKNFAVFSEATGEFKRKGFCAEGDVSIQARVGEVAIETSEDCENCVLRNGVLEPAPIDLPLERKKILQRINECLAEKQQQPICVDGVFFDANSLARERISGTIARLQRGDGLQAGWMGWRDASNDMQWAADDAATVLASLTALSLAIENREQALLVASWTHKANISALDDIDAILAYDVTAAW